MADGDGPETGSAAGLDEAVQALIARTVPCPIVAMDREGRIVWANRLAEELFAPPGGTVVGTMSHEFVHEDDLGLALAATELLSNVEADRFGEDGTLPSIYRLRTADGTFRAFEIDGRLADTPQGTITISSVRDAARMEYFTRTITHIATGSPLAETVASILATESNLDRRRMVAVTWTDDDGARVTAAGHLPESLAWSQDPADPWHRAVATGEAQVVEVGALRPALREEAEALELAVCMAIPVPDPSGAETACIVGWAPADAVAAAMLARLERSVPAMLHLALDRRHHLAQLTHAATRDALTGLHNRRQLLERLAELAAAGQPATLLFCDLDGFKPINDGHGHVVGDLVLAEVADRLAAVTRGTDVTARLGGDEFAVVVTELDDTRPAVALAERIIAAVCQPISCDTDTGPVEVRVGVSVGVAVPAGSTAGSVGVSPDALVVAADGAMYEAKRAKDGRPRVVQLDG